MAVAAHIPVVVEFSVAHGDVSVTAKSNGEVLVWTFPLPVFRRSLASAERFLSEHDAAGEVVRMGKAK